MINNNWINFQSPAQIQRLENFLKNEKGIDAGIKNNGQLLKSGHFNDFISCMEQFDRQAKLTGEDLATWLTRFVPLDQFDEQSKALFNKIAEKCNETLLGLSPMSSDKAILKAMSECIWTIERESDLAQGKHALAHILAAGVAERCHLAFFPIFSEAMQKEYDAALENKEALDDFLRKIMRDCVYGPSGELYQAIEHDGLNSTYENPNGDKLIVQWHALYEDDWKTFLNQNRPFIFKYDTP